MGEQKGIVSHAILCSFSKNFSCVLGEFSKYQYHTSLLVYKKIVTTIIKEQSSIYASDNFHQLED
jgi:hypothetical protein